MSSQIIIARQGFLEPETLLGRVNYGGKEDELLDIKENISANHEMGGCNFLVIQKLDEGASRGQRA